MGKLKLRVFVVALLAILVTCLMQSTLAYYSAVGTATNVVTSGGIRFKIHETTDQGTPFPEEGVYILPGDVVSKRVTVESDCEHPFYLRAKVVYGVDSKTLSADDCFKLNINEEHWQWHDGWYYYQNTVEPDAVTQPIFSHVEIVGDKVDNSYIGKTLSLSIVAQAVQSENNPLEEGRVYTALGWPAEAGGADK